MGFFVSTAVDRGLVFKPLKPTRITDSRIGLGLPGALGAQVTSTVTLPTTVIRPDTAALALTRPPWRRRPAPM
ncbi:hypothetical protein [Micromonospora sp. CPCC 206061]|uniref:hypothetical protein n=1 Tax=Micromonospora sp. CPCC 206061 TaxID=3122410 RepID=UPI002FF0AFE4